MRVRYCGARFPIGQGHKQGDLSNRPTPCNLTTGSTLNKRNEVKK